MAACGVIGHRRPLSVLRRSVFSGRVPQAYLFVGPEGVGKTLVAHEFAKLVNCAQSATWQSPEEVLSCGECSACTRIEQDRHPDIHLIRPLAKVQTESEDGAAEDTTFEGSLITTEQIGQLIGEANLKATEARRKVFIISSAEKMNVASANRLLKTLEEPPGDTTLVLTTQNLSGLLPTIISRCQVLTFHPSPLAEAEEALAQRFPEADRGALRSVVALSGGRVGAAIRLLQHGGVLQIRSRLLDLAASLPGREWFEGMMIGERLVDMAEEWWLATEETEFAERALKASPDRVKRTRMNDILDILLTWFRDLALLSAGGNSALIVNADRTSELQDAAGKVDAAKARTVCEDIEVTRKHLRGNANLRLASELLAFRLIRATR